MEIVFSASAAAFTYGTVLLFLNRVFSGKLRLQERLLETEQAGEFTVTEPRKQENLGQKVYRAVLNAVLDFIEVFIPKRKKQGGRLEEDLRRARIDMSVERYQALLLVKMGAMGAAGFFAGRITGADILTSFLYLAGGIYLVFALERFSLAGKIKKRKEAIYHALPDMMDLLNVSVTAGLGFDQAITYISDKGEGPLYEELATTQREITLGKPRAEALGAFADRCDNSEIKTFVGACLQADAMGSSLRNILRIQSDTIRETHKQDVETKINQLPVKILFPIVFCIFPCLFMVLLGPAALTALEAFR